MQFCPKCGSILIQRRKNFGCPRCSFTTKEKLNLKIGEKFGEKKKVDVLKESDVDVLPTVEQSCSKCGHKFAHFWTMQTRSADESETRFFRCKKCKHTWREYD